MAQRLKSLKTDPAFQYLKDIVEKKRQRVFDSLAKSLWLTGDYDKEKLAYERGFWEGAKHVLDRPENAEKAFTDALKRLGDKGDSE